MTEVSQDKEKEVYQYLCEHNENVFLSVNYIYNEFRDGTTDLKNYNIGVFKKSVNWLKQLLAYISVYFLVIFNLPFRKKINYNRQIAFARVSRSRDKLQHFNKDFEFITDDIKNRDFTIYRVGSTKKRLSFLLEDFRKLYKGTIREAVFIVDNNSDLRRVKNYYLNYLKMRIPHFIWYYYACDEIMKKTKFKEVFTGTIADLANAIERKAAREENKTLVCIPHGREYVIKMPGGLMGHKNYCTTKIAAEILKKNYPNQLFLFDYEINKKIYSYETTLLHSEKRVVYFSESLKEGKDIVKNLAAILKPYDIQLYVKLHPEDLDIKEQYEVENIEFIYDYADAITNCIALAIHSTALVEAYYNNSISVCLERIVSGYEGGNLLDSDKTHFPESYEDLIQIIKKYRGL